MNNPVLCILETQQGRHTLQLRTLYFLWYYCTTAAKFLTCKLQAHT